MDRAEALAALIDPARQRGLEIGPLDRPMVARAIGPVEYVDRASREALVAAYDGHDVDRARIPEIDHVWGEQSLLDCVGGARAYDYVLASHVIEHIPDVFGWLGEIASVLADGGLAVFFVPDKRYTFDARRPVSTAGEFVDAHLRRLRRPDARQVFNHVYDTRDLKAPPLDEAALTERAWQGLDLARRTGAEYLDAHCWVFTPHSLVDALDLASRLDLLPFELAHTEQGADEFLVALRRLPEAMPPAARREAFMASAARFALPDDTETGGDAAVLQAQARAALARADAIENSTIWRATAPLRALLGRLRR
ncbi:MULTISPECIES: bifunctional 2-polyprenyl-6-hydroxyphenol methylase/3-demethylubiquinol 3-O-methyltransferase UbiG [unclassified Phenylobacterium]|uniref:class I SAM-dependent methyltransferase n=1 Tax=unclassified Phenylobacterium TaxID=2640670 RepID=UPI00083B59E3|nr:MULTISPECIES: methyltransferase domain-containing protein [unclassified Phenylobacterium]